MPLIGDMINGYIHEENVREQTTCHHPRRFFAQDQIHDIDPVLHQRTLDDSRDRYSDVSRQPRKG
jgi:hypothetical protein